MRHRFSDKAFVYDEYLLIVKNLANKANGQQIGFVFGKMFDDFCSTEYSFFFLRYVYTK